MRRANYHSVGPEDDWLEVVDSSGKVWQVHGSSRQAIGSVGLQRIDVSGDGIDEWVLSTGEGTARQFALLQTTEPSSNVAVIGGAGDFLMSDGVAEMLGGRWIPNTDRNGLLGFLPERRAMQCPNLLDC